MNKILFAGAATLAGALILSHGTAFADDNPEMTNLLRSSAKYNYRIVDDAGLKDTEAAEDSAPRRRKRDDDRAAKASRTEASRRAASTPAASTPAQETAYYPRSGPPGPWTGVYLGLNAGGVMESRQTVATTGLDTYDLPGYAVGDAFARSAASSIALGGSNGFIGGGQIGYNYQIDNVVLGAEADFQGTTASGGGEASGAGFDPSSGVTPITLTRVQSGLTNFGTLRARAGYLVTPTLLAYVTGGLAYGQTSVNTALFSVDTAGLLHPGVGSASYGSFHPGWTAGAGVEWMFWPRWSAKLEYLYYDLGAPSLGMVGIGYNLAATPVGAYLATTTPPRFSGSIVRAGVNYHLDWGIPGSILPAQD